MSRVNQSCTNHSLHVIGRWPDKVNVKYGQVVQGHQEGAALEGLIINGQRLRKHTTSKRILCVGVPAGIL